MVNIILNHPFIFFYLIPMFCCVVGCWVGQIIDDSDLKETSGFMALIPIANIFGAIILIVVLFGCIMYFILHLPTYGKEYLRKK